MQHIPDVETFIRNIWSSPVETWTNRTCNHQVVKRHPGLTLRSFIGKTGGEIFHEMMLRRGVKHIFGYPGGTILPVFDAIYNSPHFDFILPKHEQGAGHMAEGYAKASGKAGVVLVTSGPGATNLITPMQNALSDGTPLVVVCGQVATSAIGSDAFQEADVVGISRSCTKWNMTVKGLGSWRGGLSRLLLLLLAGGRGRCCLSFLRMLVLVF